VYFCLCLLNISVTVTNVFSVGWKWKRTILGFSDKELHIRKLKGVLLSKERGIP
jgi:hypothetical protein